MTLSSSRKEAVQLTSRRKRMRTLLLWAGIALAFAFAAGCFDNSNGTSPPTIVYAPVTLLERGGGATKITIFPDSATIVGDGVVHYAGSATAEIAGDSTAGRSPLVITGTAEATVNDNTGERDFTFSYSGTTDLGWSGLNANLVSIQGSGPFSGGTAVLSAGATLDNARASEWGFDATVINVEANLAAESPIYTAYADTGSVGNPLALVGSPNPGGTSLNANAMALVFAPVGGESAVGPVSPGRWVKFVLSGSVPLRDGALLAWDAVAATLRGGGSVGTLSTPAGSVGATVELTASATSSYLSFSGNLDPPQLGVLSDALGVLWSDASCSGCGDLTMTGGPVTVGTLEIPSLTGSQKIRNGSTTNSGIRGSRVRGSLGPVEIESADLTVDVRDLDHLYATLDVAGRVVGIPVRTTFSGPFSFDLAQMSVTLSGNLFLDLNNQVVLNGDLTATVSTAGVQVDYAGAVRLPGYGANFTVNGTVSYDLSVHSLGLNVRASGNVGSISVRDVAFDLGLVPAGGGIDVNGSLAVGSIASGTASLNNLRIGFAGNTASAVSASINSSADPARVLVGSFADVTAYGSATYTPSTNTLRLNLNFSGRVSSWQLSSGNLALNWPGSGNITGSITVGQISNGQVTLS
ncbi:MAG: hypothetical protein C4318_08915, partial [Acidimicrobiia bacterium]